MDEKQKPNEVYISTIFIYISDEDIDNFDGTTNDIEQLGKYGVITQMLNIIVIVENVGIWVDVNVHD
jgi:hypothetical protein